MRVTITFFICISTYSLACTDLTPPRAKLKVKLTEKGKTSIDSQNSTDSTKIDAPQGEKFNPDESIKATDTDDGAATILAALSANLGSMPRTLKETGLFTGGNPSTPSAALVPYDVKLPLWSDGASKARYIFVPKGQSISFDPSNKQFNYPIGTVFIKHFAADSAKTLPIETRISVLKQDGRWSFATYVYDDQGIAALNERPRSLLKGETEFRVPSESECHLCHSETRNVLGFSMRHLNMMIANDRNQVEILAERLTFRDSVTNLLENPGYHDPGDTRLSIETRVRAYMDVNCSPCHHPGGPENANKMDMRLDSADTRLVSHGKLVPGNLEKSRVWEVLNSTELGVRMPYLNLRVDPLAVLLFKEYIEQFPTP